MEDSKNEIAPQLTPEQQKKLQELKQRHIKILKHHHGFVPSPPDSPHPAPYSVNFEQSEGIGRSTPQGAPEYSPERADKLRDPRTSRSSPGRGDGKRCFENLASSGSADVSVTPFQGFGIFFDFPEFHCTSLRAIPGAPPVLSRVSKRGSLLATRSPYLADHRDSEGDDQRKGIIQLSESRDPCSGDAHAVSWLSCAGLRRLLSLLYTDIAEVISCRSRRGG